MKNIDKENIIGKTTETLFDTISEAQENLQELKETSPYLFPQYLNWQDSLVRLEQALREEKRLREIWENLGK